MFAHLSKSQTSRTSSRAAAHRQNTMAGPAADLGKSVIQRIAFKNNDGSQTIDVTENEIVEYLYKWIIKKMKDDELTTPPLSTDLHQKHLNWNEVYPQGGQVRQVNNAFDAYNVLKEAKMSPGYTFALDHGTPRTQSQFASSTLRNTDRTDRGAIDGMVYPSGNLGKDVKGEGVAYKELSMSFSSLADKHGGDTEVAKAHLSLMKGNTPDGYSADELSKMRYHLEVLLLAEGRRSAGMFMFAPIGLQNIADGKVTAPEAFGKVEKKKVAKKKKKEDDDDDTEIEEGKEKNVVTEEGNFPSAWEKSKKPLEEIEKHFAMGRSITTLTKTDQRNALGKMRLHVNQFFSTTDHTDFTNVDISGTPGAAFTDKEGALLAIAHLIRDTYFPTIPAFYSDPANDTVKRKENREAQTHLLGQHQIQHEVHGLTADLLDAEQKEEFKGQLREAKDDALKLTDKDPQKRLLFKQKKNILSKLKTKDMEKFSDDDSADEHMTELQEVVEERNKGKRASGKEKKKIKVKRDLKRRFKETVDRDDDLSGEESASEVEKGVNRVFEEHRETKKRKSDPFQKGEELANAGSADISGLVGFVGQEHLVQAGFQSRVRALQHQGYIAGLKGDAGSGLGDHPHAMAAFEQGLAIRNNVKQMAIEDKGKGTPRYDLNIAELVDPSVANDFGVYQSLTTLYWKTFYEHTVNL
ncbi:hypothetical protein [Dinghuibacter silviterrae]|nr:hypothetical protein [Dinghuibacter silviterrae]